MIRCAVCARTRRDDRPTWPRVPKTIESIGDHPDLTPHSGCRPRLGAETAGADVLARIAGLHRKGPRFCGRGITLNPKALRGPAASVWSAKRTAALAVHGIPVVSRTTTYVDCDDRAVSLEGSIPSKDAFAQKRASVPARASSGRSNMSDSRRPWQLQFRSARRR